MDKKTVLITGASRGIGAATARLFAGMGYNLTINCNRSFEDLTALQKELQDEYDVDCLALKADVGNPAEVNYMCEATVRKFGDIDILVNNAAISITGLLTDMTDEQWSRIINTNLSSVFYCCRQVAPRMISRKEGSIINVSSVWGIYGASCEVAYSATKGGVNAFTKALAKELGPSGIRVNAIAFGIIDTAMNKNLSEEERQDLADETAVGRFATPEEAGKVIVDIATEHPYLTGQVLQFDGGWI